MKKALFLDRDGVINVDGGYVSRIEDFEPVQGLFDALRTAVADGYLLIVVTNQSGIGRGYFTRGDYDALEEHMRRLFAAEGVPLTAVYHCPHRPNDSCECRKPAPGMILQAAREHDIDLTGSIMIGDKPSDVQAARAAGVGRVEMVSPGRSVGQILAATRGG